MKKCVGDEVKIKAAGGIRTLDTALRMIELGGIPHRLHSQRKHCRRTETQAIKSAEGCPERV